MRRRKGEFKTSTEASTAYSLASKAYPLFPMPEIRRKVTIEHSWIARRACNASRTPNVIYPAVIALSLRRTNRHPAEATSSVSLSQLGLALRNRLLLLGLRRGK